MHTFEIPAIGRNIHVRRDKDEPLKAMVRKREYGNVNTRKIVDTKHINFEKLNYVTQFPFFLLAFPLVPLLDWYAFLCFTRWRVWLKEHLINFPSPRNFRVVRLSRCHLDKNKTWKAHFCCALLVIVIDWLYLLFTTTKLNHKNWESLIFRVDLSPASMSRVSWVFILFSISVSSSD